MNSALRWGIALIVKPVRRAAGWIESVRRRAFGHPGFRKIVSEFFLEAGVLWFVFPVLDTIVQFGAHKVTLKMTVGSIAIAVGCLFLAGLFSSKDESGEG